MSYCCFLVETSSKEGSKIIQNLLGEVLKDKTILIVDDDIRNIYALSSALTTGVNFNSV
jgi:PleD family two-component response regulator